MRDEEYDEQKEFNPTPPSDELREILVRNKPVYVNFTKEQRAYYLETGKVPMFN